MGEGFDSDNFGALMAMFSDFYKVTERYQLLYWAGCNSYSYYTLPFFDYKVKASGGRDPNGTKGLDIISNALPSLFLLNSRNAVTVAKSLLRWTARTSFQSIIDELESNARNAGTRTLTVVLGDEDNPQ